MYAALPLSCEGREVVSDTLSAQGKHNHNNNEKKYGSGEAMGKGSSNNTIIW